MVTCAALSTGEPQVGLSLLSKNVVQKGQQNLTLYLVTNRLILTVIYEAFFILELLNNSPVLNLVKVVEIE